jgi:hypothetical protein
VRTARADPIGSPRNRAEEAPLLTAARPNLAPRSSVAIGSGSLAAVASRGFTCRSIARGPLPDVVRFAFGGESGAKPITLALPTLP